jgi:hypothetical protein
MYGSLIPWLVAVGIIVTAMLPGAAFADGGELPAVENLPASHVTRGTATFDARINPESSSTTYYFVYRPIAEAECEDRQGCGQRSQEGGPIIGDSQQETAPIEVTGLVPGQTYVYWLIAQNSEGAVRGHELSFTTPIEAAPSEVQTEPAEPTSSGFTLKGRLNPGNSPTNYYFVYRKADEAECEDREGCGQRSAVGGPVIGNTQQEVSPIEVTGLAAGQVYVYWLIARNGLGTVRGRELSFTAPTESVTVSGGSGDAQSGTPSSTSQSGGPPIATGVPVVGASLGSPPFGGTLGLRLPTNAQRLAKALEICRKEKKSRRASCAKRAREKYPTRTRRVLTRRR